MKRLPIQPPRPIRHPLRDFSTAVTTIQQLPNHRRRVTIDHQPLHGVTPEMVLWWFQNIGGTMEYDDRPLDNYLAWHPVDHIRWELAQPSPSGGAQEGARFRIVEAFGAKPEYYIDTTERVEKLDATGIRLVRRFAGVKVMELAHTWSRCEGHTHYVSVMEIGAVSRAFRPVNRYLNQRRFPRDMAQAWIKHNIEEVGLLEHLLPIVHPNLQPVVVTH
jgi:hypothetical protein